jgi:hypothetical protein
VSSFRAVYDPVVATDQGRYLDRNASRPPTDSLWRALAGEPEMVDEVTEATLSRAARHARDERLRDAWRAAHQELDGVLDQFEREAHPDKRTASDTRVIRRTAQRISQRLGA